MTIDRLGPYEIHRRIGRGGMGTVYAAVNLQTGEAAAVKLLFAPMALDQDFRQRFETEIETLRKLNHPNIVRLFGFGEQDGHLFYGMELIEGSSLEDQLSRGRVLGWREVTQIGIEIGRALRHAHDRGVVHRDLKPGNLLLTADDHAKLSDFGIARLFGNLRQTGEGSVLGTVEYMAPEQAEGRPVGPRADLYSLGAVLYVLLTRRLLFPGGSFVEVLHKQRFETPDPVRRFVADVPVELEQIVMQLLEKDPERRIANATLLVRQLEAMQQALTLRAGPTAQQPEEPAPAPPGTIQRMVGEKEVDLLAATRAATSEVRAQAAVPASPAEEALAKPVAHGGVAVPPAGESPVERPPEEPSAPATALFAHGPATAVAAAQSPGHFTTVPAEDLDRPETATPRPAWVSPQTWVLAGSLLVVGLAIWYFLQPPSADRLYDRVAARAAENSIDALEQAEGDIQQFLTRYSSDWRSEQLRGYEDQIELHRLEHRIELRAKGLAANESLMPVEQTYLEALAYARLSPELGMAKFQALLALYDTQGERQGPTGRYLQLAHRRLTQLGEQLEQQSPAHLALLQDRLNEADRLRRTEPARAERIYRAVVELYGEKPWAATVVRRARNALEERRTGGK
ncbi:MAG: protein kinase [Thermoguttaceae bacterium]|jgi:serine/threonine-protein kinase